MTKRHVLLVSAVSFVSLLLPAQGAYAQECQPDDFDPGCRAQRTCQQLANKTHLVSCTQ
jgi:hypothetical protein